MIVEGTYTPPGEDSEPETRAVKGIGGVFEKFKDRDEWLRARGDSIGGSDAAAIVNGKALDVYTDKIGLKEDEDLPVYKRGRILEPIVADMLQEETGHVVVDLGKHHLFKSTQVPFFHYSDDRVIVEAKGKNGPGIVEIKTCPFMSQMELAENARDIWLTQPQHGMNVLELEWSCLVVLAVVPWTISYIFVERSDRFIKALNPILKHFWDRVQNRMPPPPDDIDSSRAALSRLYPGDNGETVKLPETAVEIVAKLEEAKAKAKEWNNKEEAAKNALKAMIGPNSFGVLPDGRQFSLLTTLRKSYSVSAKTYRTLRERNVT